MLHWRLMFIKDETESTHCSLMVCVTGVMILRLINWAYSINCAIEVIYYWNQEFWLTVLNFIWHVLAEGFGHLTVLIMLPKKGAQLSAWWLLFLFGLFIAITDSYTVVLVVTWSMPYWKNNCGFDCVSS